MKNTIINLIDKNGEKNQVTITSANNDVNGNPRYIVHYLSLDMSDYISTKETRSAGLSMYRGKSYGGGYVFSTYDNLERAVQKIYNKIHNIK